MTRDDAAVVPVSLDCQIKRTPREDAPPNAELARSAEQAAERAEQRTQ